MALPFRRAKASARLFSVVLLLIFSILNHFSCSPVVQDQRTDSPEPTLESELARLKAAGVSTQESSSGSNELSLFAAESSAKYRFVNIKSCRNLTMTFANGATDQAELCFVEKTPEDCRSVADYLQDPRIRDVLNDTVHLNQIEAESLSPVGYTYDDSARLWRKQFAGTLVEVTAYQFSDITVGGRCFADGIVGISPNPSNPSATGAALNKVIPFDGGFYLLGTVTGGVSEATGQDAWVKMFLYENDRPVSIWDRFLDLGCARGTSFCSEALFGGFVTADGGIIAVGRGGSPYKGIVRKFTREGDLDPKWTKDLDIGAVSFDLHSVVADSQGSVYVAGVEDAGIGTTVHVKKFDSDGNEIIEGWDKRIGDSQVRHIATAELAVDDQDRVYVGTSMVNASRYDSDNDAWLRRYAADGDMDPNWGFVWDYKKTRNYVVELKIDQPRNRIFATVNHYGGTIRSHMHAIDLDDSLAGPEFRKSFVSFPRATIEPQEGTIHVAWSTLDLGYGGEQRISQSVYAPSGNQTCFNHDFFAYKGVVVKDFVTMPSGSTLMFGNGLRDDSLNTSAWMWERTCR